MRVHVSVKDIKQGQLGDGAMCPIALAIGRLLPDDYSCHVNCDFIRWYKPGMRGSDYDKYAGEVTPNQACHKFIDDFDTGKPVRPFSFWLRTAGTELGKALRKKGKK